MEDFNNDGLLDIRRVHADVAAMALYRNRGDGTFRRIEPKARAGYATGRSLLCANRLQHDGPADIFVCRGGWMEKPQRPSLLRNNGDGTFTDVTVPRPVTCATPAGLSGRCLGDYDNDGLFWIFFWEGRRIGACCIATGATALLKKWLYCAGCPPIPATGAKGPTGATSDGDGYSRLVGW